LWGAATTEAPRDGKRKQLHFVANRFSGVPGGIRVLVGLAATTNPLFAVDF